MTIIKHYINNRWKWDFDGSHTAYDIVSQITDQYNFFSEHYSKCNIKGLSKTLHSFDICF